MLFVKLEKTELNSVKGYYVYKDDENRQFMRAEMLVVFKLAKKK